MYKVKDIEVLLDIEEGDGEKEWIDKN